MNTPLTRARLAGPAGCVVVALLASACGGHPGPGTSTSSAPPESTPATNGIAAKPPAQILKAARHALASAASVRLRGTFTDSGHLDTVDVVVGRNVAKGSMTGELGGGSNVSFHFVVAGGKMYLRSSPATWRKLGGANVASLVRNRWVLLPRQTMHNFPFFGPANFAKSLAGDIGTARAVGAKVRINRQPAITVSATRATVYVAARGTPYPLRIVPRSRKDGGLYFSGYDTPVTITAPRKVLDFSKLAG